MSRMGVGTMGRILVTGASGQIGSELVPHLRSLYGQHNVLATDIRQPAEESVDQGMYEPLDVTVKKRLEELVNEYRIESIFHLAALLSASGEQNPGLAWRVNLEGLYNVLEVSRTHDIGKVFFPSSIAVFGPETPKNRTPQYTVIRPRTMYGITKVTGELLCDYYFRRFGVDVRCVRYPGVISSKTPPGGGTTDYAVEMFYSAVRSEPHVCFVRDDTTLPMMYMPDCIKAAVMLMEADSDALIHRADYNLSSMSFSARELAEEIRRHIPDFRISYLPDFRQVIADSWPSSIDDSYARIEWGWNHSYDLETMSKDMIEQLSKRLSRWSM